MVLSYLPSDYEGTIISVEAAIRRGIPGLEIVGLPDAAVREAKERIRIASLQSGFAYPSDRIVVNLAPAGVRKCGSGFDLPICLAILLQSEQLLLSLNEPVLVMGELQLSGQVRPVKGVLPAVAEALEKGIRYFIVPQENLKEGSIFGGAFIRGIEHLTQLPQIVEALPKTSPTVELFKTPPKDSRLGIDFSDIKGQPELKRALEVAAAGMHHTLLFGPPGTGKTLSATALHTIVPNLTREEALEVTRVWSLAGMTVGAEGLIHVPPFRVPHHSASAEGIIGGGRELTPGEVSLAHNGILLLDETPIFAPKLLQSLREPLETGKVSVVRADRSFQFPANFQLIMTANPCPCGNLGRREGVCICTRKEIYRYWQRVGGALMDRVDIRIPVKPIRPEKLIATDQSESSSQMRERVLEAIERQRCRYQPTSFKRNGRLSPGVLRNYCPLTDEGRKFFIESAERLSLSARACHSILKIARTVADLNGHETIGEEALVEALCYRQYGDRDIFWDELT